MSESDDDTSLQGIEEALARLNVSILSYNKSKQDGVKSRQPSPPENIPASESLYSICVKFANSVEWDTGAPHFSRGWDLETADHFPKITDLSLRKKLNALHELKSFLPEHGYSIDLYSRIASAYVDTGYPDLAAGAAYKALLLIDNLEDEDNEFYDVAFLALAESISKESLPARCERLKGHPELQESLFHPEHAQKDDEGYVTFPVGEGEVHIWASEEYSRRVYITLAQCLHECGCERSAAEYCNKGLEMFPVEKAFKETLDAVNASVREYLKDRGEDFESKLSIEQYPDQGMVRRECYPWNDHEPNRCSDESVAFLNAEMQKVAPKLEVKATDLPALAGEEGTSRQLGVFAKEDIAPGGFVLEETSLLTANNRLQDALCDACSADLPEMTDPAFAEVVDCPECSVVFCNQHCFDLAMEEYHPATCDRGVEDIAKNVPPTEAANTLYTLLLLRALAMAETQSLHPLDLKYVKFIWGDYHTHPLSTLSTQIPHTLPFSFQANVVLPFNMLEMMDIDIFSNLQYDIWVFNTLYAKFRGTASARLSGLSGRPVRGPEVSAVHPNWCLANHSCDPNVTWNWASQVKFRVLEQRALWQVGGGGVGGGDLGGRKAERRNSPGLKKGEEVLSHYCDVELAVNQRREWAAGSLGGDCRCERCCFEAGEATA